MCGFHSVAARRMSPRSSWTPSACTSWPMARSVEMTSYSVRHGADGDVGALLDRVRRNQVPVHEREDAQLVDAS